MPALRAERTRLLVSALANALLTLASVGFTLLALECGARVLFPEPAPTGLAALGLADLSKPGMSGSFLSVPFRTNTYGFRGPDYTARPERGTFRIAITGDSVTMGWGVPEESAYPALLESLLNRESERRVEVQNLGLAGVNAHEAMERLELANRVYSPQLLVYGFTVNDIEGKFYRSPQLKSQLRLIHRIQRWKESPWVLLWLFGP